MKSISSVCAVRASYCLSVFASVLILSGCQSALDGASLPSQASARPKPSATERVRVSLDEDSDVFTHLRTAKASQRTLAFIVDATGQLQPNANAVTRISAPVSGKIASITASLGEMVRPGQVLATLTSQDIGALVTDLFKTETEIASELSRNLFDIDCELKQARAELTLCQKQHGRAKLLLEERIGSISAVEVLQTELDKHELTISALEEKKARIKSVAEEKKGLARLALEQKLTLLGMPKKTIADIMNSHNIVSTVPLQTPHAGFVLERNVNMGELVDPARTLFVVDDIDNLWLVADIFEQDVEYVSIRQEIEFTVDSFPNQRFKGKLDFVAGTINPETRTLAVRAVIPNPGCKLKPKMFVRMKIMAGNHQVLAVPKKAVQDASSEKVVYVQCSKTTFEERVVHLGEESGDYVEILDGISPGELVVTTGSFSLRSQSLKQSLKQSR